MMKTHNTKWIMAVFFIILAAAGFAFMASGASSPLHTSKDKAYNKILQKAKRQEKLGWDVTVTALRSDGKEITYELLVTGKSGAPIVDADIRLKVVNISDNNLSLSMRMHNISDGKYMVKFFVPEFGEWEIRTSLRQGENNLYYRKRFVIDESSIKWHQ